METVHLPSLLRFHPEKLQKAGLFQTPRFFCDAYCLLPGQAQRPHAHPREDKMYLVWEGTVDVQVGDEEQTLGQGMAALAPAGVVHGVTNRSGRPAVLLVTMAPSPGA